MKSLFLSLVLTLTISISLKAQLSGIVTDENNNSLPYVNVYVKNTSLGTTTNPEGRYVLELSKGQHEIIFQYIGFKNQIETINYENRNEKLDVVMVPETYQLQEVTISANAEDPAYAIIRKAQAKRKYYKKLLDNYECDAYVRGFNKVVNAPEKVLGIEIGDFEGALDSNRTGVVYLSESISKLYYKEGKSKEVMYSSKMSGNDQIYSFNSAQEMDLNFYSNTVELNRKLVSPIATNAMAHYKYKLEGATYDSNGQLFNKIKVIPKNKYGNSFSGYIYINENLWNIHSLELSATKEATQIPVIDTLTFKQIYAPLNKEDWIPMSNIAIFEASAFGFGIEGNFACVYSNYIMGEVTDDIFNNVVYKVEKEANERTDNYWDTIRPIPLTIEEKLDYQKKDSIKIVRESPAYLDSIDRKANEFEIKDLLLGYNKQNSFTRTKVRFSSIIGNIRLNSIQGWNSTFKIGYNKNYNKVATKTLHTELGINYGLSEKVLRPNLSAKYRANRTSNLVLEASAGKQLTQYSRLNPIRDWINSFYTLIGSKNYLKAYDKEYLTLKINSDLLPGLSGDISVDYENRRAVTNNYLTETKRADKNYTSNNPQLANNDSPAFENHQAVILRASLLINIGQKIWSYPDRKFKVNSSWPTLGFYYKSGLKILGGDTKYHLLYSRLTKRMETSIYGHTKISLLLGDFVGDEQPEYFIDYMHAVGNQTHLGFPQEYRYSFLNLPYYSNSTNGRFFSAHLEHNFEGYLLSKVPLLKKLGWQFVGGYKILANADRGSYQEVHIGLDNIGIKAVRLFRLDLVWSRQYCGPLELCSKSEWKPALIIGLKLN